MAGNSTSSRDRPIAGPWAVARWLVILGIAGWSMAPAFAAADSPSAADDPDQTVELPHRLAGSQLNLAMNNSLPASLGTGLSTGLAARWLQPGRWTWGGELSGSTATEYGASWEVNHLDVRARAVVGLQGSIGRGRVAVLLGLGPTAIRENRLRNQGERLGLSGEALEQTTWGALGSADLLAVVSLPVVGPWAAVVAAGPALHISQSGTAAGWTAQLGVGWLP